MEVRAIAKTQLPELLREIKKNGTKISVIHGADDDAFPMERVQKMVNSEIIDGFYSVKGSHAEVRTKEAKKAYTELARYALEKMSEKK